MKHLFEKLQHQFPKPHIDKIEHIQPESHIITIKNVSLSDTGYEPDRPISHQLLIDAHVESSVIYLLNENHLNDYTYELANISSFNALTAVFSGDQIRIETEMKKNKSDIVSFESRGYVNGTQCSEIKLNIRQANPTTSSTFIHPTASVHSSAILGQGVHIGPYCIVNEGVTIGDHSILKAHVMIDKWCVLGASNRIEYGAVIGAEPQDIKYKGEMSSVTIGNHNIIREYVTINRATGKGNATQVGSHNMILTNTHIGHNCTIGNHVVMANMVHIGGHVVIDDHATIGGITGVHQFVRVGTLTMIGGYSRLIQDVPPYMLCDGNPAHVRNLNAIGCKRNGMKKATLSELKTLYKLLYRSNLNTKQALKEYSPVEACDEADRLIAFINVDASRGISKKTTSDSSGE